MSALGPSLKHPLIASVACCVDPDMTDRALTILRLLAPKQPVEGEKIRVGRNNDGGYVMIDRNLNKVPAYSLGIEQDVSWDKDMAQRGCTLFQYDGTIDGLPESHPAFHFEAVNIVGTDSTRENEKTLSALLKKNKHLASEDLVLKIDIEDSEWDVFDNLSEEDLVRFSQIVVEYHNLTETTDPLRFLKTERCLKKMNKSHQVVHIHANNYGSVGYLGGVFLPDVLELTYLRKKGNSFERCLDVFPLAIDQPNRPDAPDIFLGALGLLGEG
ncbi:MAG: FkbM family methyltransferase [Bdellovibrionales bacterium]